MKRTIAAAAATAAAAAAVLAPALPAQAATGASCTYSAASHSAWLTLNGPVARTVARDAAGAITVNGVACGAATVKNTAYLGVVGDADAQTLTVSLAGGALSPGYGADTGQAELEVKVSLGNGTDVLRVAGGPGADVLRAGAAGINLTWDTDADVTLGGVEQLVLLGNGGADTLSGQGWSGTTATTLPLTLSGGEGSDEITGGSASDVIDGGLGDDTVSGAAGTDTLTYASRTAAVSATLGFTGGQAGEKDVIALDIETLVGGAGNDVLRQSNVGAGSPTRLVGNAGNDVLTGGGAGDVLLGGPGNDVLRGGGGSNTLYGEAGDDSYQAMTTDAAEYGKDWFSGGVGTDTADYSKRTAAVKVVHATGQDGQIGEGDTVGPDVERLVGGSGNDVLAGTGAHDRLFGRGGDDTLTGGAGHDILEGGDGRDRLVGGDGNDTLSGQADDDILDGGLGRDWMDGGTGRDQVSYLSRAVDPKQWWNGVQIDLQDGVDDEGLFLAGEPAEFDAIRSTEVVRGTKGNDSFRGVQKDACTAMVDGDCIGTWFYGEAGDDTFTATGTTDYWHGGAGGDSFNAMGGDHICAVWPDGNESLERVWGGFATLVEADSWDYVYGGTRTTGICSEFVDPV